MGKTKHTQDDAELEFFGDERYVVGGPVGFDETPTELHPTEVEIEIEAWEEEVTAVVAQKDLADRVIDGPARRAITEFFRSVSS